mgnify:CR=1 FL=1
MSAPALKIEGLTKTYATGTQALKGVSLEIPEGAVVVPGARGVTSSWGASQALSLQTPVIVKYRDEKTDLATALEEWLR